MTIELLITRFKSIMAIVVDKVKTMIEKLGEMILDKRNDKIKKIILEIGCTTQPI